MKIVLFCHSLLSDWNHGNAHFLRGVVSELSALGHEVVVYEPRDSWSAQNLEAELGELPFSELYSHYPRLEIVRYGAELDLDRALSGARLVLVHEWTAAELVQALGEKRKRGGGFRLLFHDTHHRSVSDAAGIARLDLSGYDAVLAFGEALRERYVAAGWARRAFTWHEAADVRLFRPLASEGKAGDLVFIGNFGDEERTLELERFFFEPVAALGLRAKVFGVRYPEHGRLALSRAGIEFGGYLANYRVPELLAAYHVTIHVPRRPYVEALPGIPTIRVFEALACGIPLVSAPWCDVEGLFGPEDFVIAADGQAMQRALAALLADQEMARELGERGRQTILERHTCAHRARELLDLATLLGLPAERDREPALVNAEALLWD